MSEHLDVGQYIAFLRAINVGGRNVKMAQLRELFESLGGMNVETFIASGNVIFDVPDKDTRTLEREIEDHLRTSLGYEVATFVRSVSELAEVAHYQPFTSSDLSGDGNSLYVAFLQDPPTVEAEQKLMTYRSEIDEFHVHGREIYWLCRMKMSESSFSGALLERAIGMPATMRNGTTIRRLVTKYPPSQ